MKLIIDTNVLISAILKDSLARKILFNPKFEFYVCEFVFEEIAEHFQEIIKKSGLSSKDLMNLLNEIKGQISIIPSEIFSQKLESADRIIGNIDKKDIPLAALALAIPNEGIWTNDKHFLGQKKIKAWATAELMGLIE